jgi:Putative prokaryotic signal transducing protein
MADTPDAEEKLVKIFDTQDESEGMVVRGLLASAGIDAILQSEEATDVFPVGGLALLVREEQADEARQIIEGSRRDADQELSEEQEQP